MVSTSRFIIRSLLQPFALLYGLGTSLRNRLYDAGRFRSFQFDTPTISVGNLRVGGTGKTPHIEYLIRLLQPNYQVATLSRGYGRQTKGFLLADPAATPRNLGDEPVQFYRKFSGRIAVAVAEDRLRGIPLLLGQKPDTQVILLDDAFQHRSVRPHLNILLSDYYHPFYCDWLLPAGRLRESRSGARRSDLVVISKCPPHLTAAQRQKIEQEVQSYLRPGTPVVFTGLRYGAPTAFGTGTPAGTEIKSVLLVSGIAQPWLFEQGAAELFSVADHLTFHDHHDYSAADARRIAAAFQELAGEGLALLTTEKDFVKLSEPALAEALAGLPLYYLPIKVNFLHGQADFEAAVRRVVATGAA